MKRFSLLLVPALLGLLTLPSALAAPAGKPLAAHQEPRGIGHLVAHGDRVQLEYGIDTPKVRAASGFVYVRNDLGRRLERLTLHRLGTVVPGRLIRGHKLLYYAVVRDPRTGRSARVPAAGQSSAWILNEPTVIRLGAHRFGRTKTPEAVVATARPEDVGWQTEGDRFGPETFLVGPEGTIWLDDGLNSRLLLLRGDAIERSLPLPAGTTDGDIARGPEGSLYVTGGVGRGLDYHRVLYRIGSSGDVLWQSRLAEGAAETGSFALGANSPLRVGPDGTLYCLAGMPGLVGGEPGWMPVASPGGRPISESDQRRRTHWPYQPVGGGLRLVSEVHTPPGVDGAPHEARYALIDRRGRVVRAWRVLSATAINFNFATPELVGGDPVVSLDVTAQVEGSFKWEYLVLRLGPHGTRSRFSLSRTVYGDNLLADLRVGPDGMLYQLGSSPSSGVTISRYSLDRRAS